MGDSSVSRSQQVYVKSTKTFSRDAQDATRFVTAQIDSNRGSSIRIVQTTLAMPRRPEIDDEPGAATVFDVAHYILSKVGPMTAMKLQKLVYYSQAWHLTWTERPLFAGEIQAWANGPVMPLLYQAHKGKFLLERGFFSARARQLSEDAQDSVDRVLAAYGDKSPQWLSDLTHAESPWRDARAGIPDGQRGEATIGRDAMVEYYSSL